MQITPVMDAKVRFLFVMILVLFGIFHQGWAQGSGGISMAGEGYVPTEGFVPDGTTAMLVARAVLIKIYGQQQIDSEQPFRAELKDGVWTVKGTLPKDTAGGVATIKILKSDGRILFVHHGK